MSNRSAQTLRGLLVIAAIVAAFCAVLSAAKARDDGRYAGVDPETRAWFNRLASGKGLCCSIADGVEIDNPDVDMHGAHYFVRVDGEWIEVPDAALILEPSKVKRAVVWPYKDSDGKTQIRCFIPGPGA
jgi:hypothetical protein